MALLPERVCQTCVSQEAWGCDAEETDQDDPMGGKVWRRPAQLPLTIDGELVWRCPRRPLKDDPTYWQRLLLHYDLFRDGHLPDEGGVSSQSFKAISLFGVVADTMAECDRDRDEQAAARRARGG